jgi:hypothetical protein
MRLSLPRAQCANALAALGVDDRNREKQIVIKKVEEGYQVLSRKGKNLGGPYKTLEKAKKRLRQVEFFKHRKAPR